MTEFKRMSYLELKRRKDLHKEYLDRKAKGDKSWPYYHNDLIEWRT